MGGEGGGLVILTLYSFLLLWVAVPLTVVVASRFVLSRRARQSRTQRNLLMVCLAILGLLLFASSPVFRVMWAGHKRQVAIEAATLHLTEPTKIGQTEFPTGSTVYVGPDGTAWSGKVPVITTIKGMPLIGAFRLGTDYTYDPAGGIALSTLAVATDVNGVPCGIGPFILRQDGLRCTLAHNYEYMGHVLMGGQPFEIDRPMQTGRTTLKVGILAGPEQLGDVAWPAGTVVGGITAPAEQLRHGVAPDGNPVQLCLSKGAEVVVPGATLHGPILYGFFRASRWVDSRCHPLSTFSYVPPDGDGYAEAGGARFQRGSWSAEKEAWIIR